MKAETVNKLLEGVTGYVKSIGYHPVYAAIYGSQNYGLDVYTEEYCSDFDYKVIVLPSLRDLVWDSKPVSTVIDYEGGHIDVKDIRAFMDTMIKCNPQYLEIMLTDYSICVGEGFNYFPAIRGSIQSFIRSMGSLFAKACYGMFLEKQKAMTHPYPTTAWKIDKWGYDGKQVHHMYRMLLMLRHFDKTGEVSLFPPEDSRQLLMDLKLNHISQEDAEAMIWEWAQEMDALRNALEDRYPVTDTFEKAKLIRFSRDMLYEHCVKEAKQQ